MKIALVHEGLFCRGGAERVILNFHRAFPEAPIYAAMYDPENTYPEFQDCDIRTSWFQKVAKNEKHFKQRFYPLCIFAMKSLDLTKYEVLLMSTTHCAKYVKISTEALVIAYCHTPFRLAWNPNSYNLYCNSTGLKRYLLDWVIRRLKKIDFFYAQRPNIYIANSKEVTNRIKECYLFDKEVQILHPSIDLNMFNLSEVNEEYYLVVSRLEKYKKVDLAIEAFNIIDKPLIVVGHGVEKAKLTKIAKTNIKFVDGIEDRQLADLYSRCKALIFPQYEDYGLTPLEANASGRPVIAYGKGGVLDTMIPYTSDAQKSTAIFFNEQSVESLIHTIKLFETLQFNPTFIREHAEKFSNDLFIKNIKKFVLSSYNEHLKNQKIKRC